ncbi:hypothetical protein CT0861_11343 [Colletotrichum tofieldiae]|uniref:Uncharacterized protein n=1 Tax=Colletotrichum tofieldiae TaxID=708197 RepID=A0A166TFH0_9PEZI|nr:hypothetical protein CT0861_11343 [Colletotrichum tofieldiae]
MRDFAILAAILLAAAGPSLVSAEPLVSPAYAVTSAAPPTSTAATVGTKLPQPAIGRGDCFRSRRRFRVPPPLPTSSDFTTTGSLSGAVSQSTGKPRYSIVKHEWDAQESETLLSLTPQSAAVAAAAASAEPQTTAVPTTTNTVASYTTTSTTIAKTTQTGRVPVKCGGRCGPKRPSIPKKPRGPKKPKNTKATTSPATVTVTYTAVPSSASQTMAAPSAVRNHPASAIPAIGKNFVDRDLQEPNIDLEDLRGLKCDCNLHSCPCDRNKHPLLARTRPASLGSPVTHTSTPISKRDLPVKWAHTDGLEVEEEYHDDTTPLAVAQSTLTTTSSPAPTTYSRRRCTRTRRPNCWWRTRPASSSSSSATSSSSTSSRTGPVTVTVTITPSSSSASTSSTSISSTSASSTSTSSTSISSTSASSPADRVTVTVTITPDYTPTYILNPSPTRPVKAREVEGLEEARLVANAGPVAGLQGVIPSALKKHPKIGARGQNTEKVPATTAPEATLATKKV